jgi:hypothetical protein
LRLRRLLELHLLGRALEVAEFLLLVQLARRLRRLPLEDLRTTKVVLRTLRAWRRALGRRSLEARRAMLLLLLRLR